MTSNVYHRSPFPRADVAADKRWENGLVDLRDGPCTGHDRLSQTAFLPFRARACIDFQPRAHLNS